MDERNFHRQLIERYLDKTATEEELEVFLKLINNADFQKEFDKQSDEVFYQMLAEQQQRRTKLFHFWKWLPYAAAILAFLSIGVLWYFQSSQDTTPQTELTSRYGDDVLPGRSRATITLADGRVIDLDSATNGLLAQEQGTSITKNDDGTVTYEAQGNGLDEGATAFNTIATPRGGQYKITLPDGTKVWLNTESSLKYPTRFTGSHRAVTLGGEAYFEVTPNAKQPFIVKSVSQSVTVLGTHFNVHAYPGEQTEITTLAEGRILVQNITSGKQLIVGAGTQTRNTGKDISMQDVNAGDYTAWKDNFFQFSGVELSDAIRQLERWYDLEVDYATIPKGKLYARINRDRKLSTILFTIEKTSGIKFKIEGRRLSIQQ